MFDRIRENFRKMRKGDSVDVMNHSINQTLRRTILTSITTLFVVLTLLIVGGEVIRGFSTAIVYRHPGGYLLLHICSQPRSADARNQS